MKITEAAAKQIRLAARASEIKNMGLRIAAKRMADGGIDYAMGFDEQQEPDMTIEKFDVVVLISPTSADLLDQATLDYVKLDDGESDFVFMNPLDPNYVPPKDE